MHADPAKTCVWKILRAQKNFTYTKKFYVHEIAAVDLSKIYFLKNAKKTCKPNNRDLNRDWKMESIICLETDVKKISVASPTLHSFLKLLEWSRQRPQYIDNSAMDFVERTERTRQERFLPQKLLCRHCKHH